MSDSKASKEKKGVVRKTLGIVGGLLLILIFLVVAYVVYALVDYHRIDDNQVLEVNNPEGIETVVSTDKQLTIQGWNLGFASYLQDYTFFMDGGKESRARSKELVIEAMNAMIKETAEIDADFVDLQEVDFDSTRSYHVDERQMVFDAFKDRSGTFAINFESPYLFYPILEPHGISNSGLLTMSKFEMQSSLRRSLPIQQDLGRFIDLDRCYDVVKFNTDNGKELVLINLHLSAYTTDPTIADQQLDMLYAQITEEYSKGNYIICSGDFNKDMLGNSAEIFPCTDNKSERNWATPFKEDKLPEHFKVAKPVDLNNPVASCRDSNIPYEKGVSFLITNDAFIVSDNIEVIKADCIDLAFEWSDHNPVYMQFKLKK